MVNLENRVIPLTQLPYGKTARVVNMAKIHSLWPDLEKRLIAMGISKRNKIKSLDVIYGIFSGRGARRFRGGKGMGMGGDNAREYLVKGARYIIAPELAKYISVEYTE